MPRLQIFAEKTFANSHKTAKFMEVFSLKTFPLYGTLCVWMAYCFYYLYYEEFVEFLLTSPSLPSPFTHMHTPHPQTSTSQTMLFYYAISLHSLFPIGLPSPPTGLSPSPQAANILRLQWEAPFSLPGENISYIFHTRNLRTGATMSGVTVSGTSTTFERPQEDQACDRYEFTVCSNNTVGPSENCTAVEASTPSGKQSFL